MYCLIRSFTTKEKQDARGPRHSHPFGARNWSPCRRGLVPRLGKQEADRKALNMVQAIVTILALTTVGYLYSRR